MALDDRDFLRLIEQLERLVPVLEAMSRRPGQSRDPAEDLQKNQLKEWDKSTKSIVNAIAKLSAELRGATMTRKEEQASMRRFAADVDRAAAAQEQQNREVTENIAAIQREKAAREEAAKAAAEAAKAAAEAARLASMTTEERTEEERQKTKERQQQERQQQDLGKRRLLNDKGALTEQIRNHRSNISSSREAFESLRYLGSPSEILRDRFLDLAGNSIKEQAKRQLLTAAIGGATKALLSYGKALYDGQQGAEVAAKSMTEFVTAVATAIQGIGTLMLFIPGMQILGVAAIAGGTAMKGLAKYTELAAAQSDRLYGSFVELTKSGVTGSDGMRGLANSAQRLGYGLDQVGIQAFNALMQSASQDLAMLAGSAADGRRSFAEFSGEIVRSDVGRQLMMMGLSVDDINTGVAGFLKQQVSLGRAQTLNQRQLREESVAYVRELDAVTKLTGIQKKELESQMDANRRNERFRAAIEKVRAEQGDDAARNLELNMAVASERFPELAAGLKDIAGGFVNIEAAAQVFRAGMGDIPKLMTRGLGAGFQELGQAANRTTKSMGSLAAVGAFGPVFGSYYEQLKAAGMSEQDAAKRALEIMKEQEKGGDAAVASQVDLRRSQMNTRDAMQSFVREGVNPATRALQKLAGIPEAAAGTLPGETPGGEMTGTAGGGGVARTVGRYLQDLGLGPRAGRTESDDQPTAAPALKGTSEAEGIDYAGAPEQPMIPGTKLSAPKTSRPAPAPSEKPLTLEDLLIFKGPSGTRERFLGMQRGIQQRVIEAAAEYNSATDGKKFTINSALRKSEDQMRLWQESVRAGRPGIGPGGMPIARPGSSPHERGIAVDINEYRDQLAVQALNRAGLFQRVPGDPVHFSLAQGGIASGPDSGYPATLHGDEAVVPLPDGRTIPVSINLSDWQQTGPTIGGFNAWRGFNAGPMTTDLSAIKDIAERVGAFDRAANTITDPKTWQTILQSGIATNFDIGVTKIGTTMLPEIRGLMADEIEKLTASGATVEQAVSQVREEFGRFMSEFIETQQRSGDLRPLLEEMISLQRTQNSTSSKILQVSQS